MFTCPGPTRREALQIGGLGVLGLVGRSLARDRTLTGQAKSCIVVFLSGGPSQFDTWDPKPDAPSEVRGEFQAISSSVPGLRVGELMPRLAAQAKRWCILRAVSTYDHAHASSVYWVLTGKPHAPLGTETVKPGPPNDWPHFGSTLRQLRGDRGGPPGFMTLPEHMMGNDFAVPQGQFAGFLGQKVNPWLLTCDPAAARFEVPALSLPPDVSADRLDSRRSLLDAFDARRQSLDRAALTGFDVHANQAFQLVGSSRTRQAFDLDREPPAMRDRYGRHKFGQSVLLARRLIEAGVTVVHVNWPREPGDMRTPNPLWDTHANHHPRMKQALMPPMDQTVSALIDDLADRGLLETTLVVWAGEFGRTPRFNSAGGRDHWGGVFSVALAGAGVQGGTVIGSSDRIEAHPQEGRVLPQDLLATIYHAFGFGPETEIFDAQGRPLAITSGTVVRGVF